MKAVEELCETLRGRGLKVTPQRRQVFEVLCDSAEHPTAEEVYQSVRGVMPDISLATVYHTLNELVEMGELVELDLGEGKSRYDPHLEDHNHLVCLGCRRVIDVPRTPDCAQLPIEEAYGYEIVRCDVVFYGYCPNCQG